MYTGLHALPTFLAQALSLKETTEDQKYRAQRSFHTKLHRLLLSEPVPVGYLRWTVSLCNTMSLVFGMLRFVGTFML